MANVTISGADHKEVLAALLSCMKDSGVLIEFEPLISTGHSSFLLKVIDDEEPITRHDVYL